KRSAFKRAASVTTAVPCSSSWKTWISSSSVSLSSISRTFGVSMSSTFMPPEHRSDVPDRPYDLVGIGGPEVYGKSINIAKLFVQQYLAFNNRKHSLWP